MKRSRRSPARAAAPSRARGPGPAEIAVAVAILLGIFLVTQYGYAIRGPFVGDDYLFIGKTGKASFASLWSMRPDVLAFHYYRPWSRELHYWALQRIFGPRTLPFHVASLSLGLAIGILYFVLVRKAAGSRAAAVATACAFALAAWGVLLVWAAGSQDLWMMAFTLAALVANAYRRRAAAVALFALALLSKETAALVPGIVLGYALWIERREWKDALRWSAPFAAVLAAWAAVHPMIGGALLHPLPPVGIPGLHRPLPEIAGRTLLALVNVDEWPRPEGGWAAVTAPAVLAVGLLGALVAMGRIGSGSRASEREEAPSTLRVAGFGATWAVLGWLPLLSPTLGFHAYYATFGMLGAWLALGSLLAARPAPLALAVVAALAVTRAGRAHTPSKDWGNEWFQVRAANFGEVTRQYLLAHHPVMAPHSRIYLANVPSGVGLVPGGEESPALRIWYGDSTLETRFVSHYRPRRPGTPPGDDYYFRYDLEKGWSEVVVQPLSPHPTDEERYERGGALWLVMRFPEAAEEFRALLRHSPDDPAYLWSLGSCYYAAGDTTEAARWYLRAIRRADAPEGMRATARRLARRLRPGERDSLSRGLL